MNNNKFSGKVALVTGGTSGIGKATAIEFARAGAKVVLTGRREKEGAQVVAEIKKLGGDAAFVRTDVAKDADVKAMVDFTVDKFGRLDVARIRQTKHPRQCGRSRCDRHRYVCSFRGRGIGRSDRVDDSCGTERCHRRDCRCCSVSVFRRRKVHNRYLACRRWRLGSAIN